MILNILQSEEFDEIEAQLELVFGVAWRDNPTCKRIEKELSHCRRQRDPIEFAKSLLDSWEKKIMTFEKDHVFSFSYKPLVFNKYTGELQGNMTMLSSIIGDLSALEFFNKYNRASISKAKYSTEPVSKALSEYNKRDEKISPILKILKLLFWEKIFPHSKNVQECLSSYYISLGHLSPKLLPLSTQDYTNLEFLSALHPPFFVGSPEVAFLIQHLQSNLHNYLTRLNEQKIILEKDIRPKDKEHSTHSDTLDNSRKEKITYLRTLLGNFFKHVKSFALTTNKIMLLSAELDQQISELMSKPIECLPNIIENIKSQLALATTIIDSSRWTVQSGAEKPNQSPKDLFFNRLNTILHAILRARMIHDLTTYVESINVFPPDDSANASAENSQSDDLDPTDKQRAGEVAWISPDCWVSTELKRASLSADASAEKRFKKISIELHFHKKSNIIVESPRFSKVRSKLLQRANKILNTFAELPDPYPSTLFKGSFSGLPHSVPPETLLPLFDSVDILITRAEAFKSSWTEFQVLWSMDFTLLFENLGTSLSRWRTESQRIDNWRKKLERKSSKKTSLWNRGPISIDASKIKEEIRKKFSSWSNTFLKQLCEVLNPMIKRIVDRINEIHKDLCQIQQEQLRSTSDREKVINFLVKNFEYAKMVDDFEIDIDDALKSEKHVKSMGFKLPSNWIAVETVRVSLKKLKTLLKSSEEKIERNLPNIVELIQLSDKKLELEIQQQRKEWSENLPGSADQTSQNAMFVCKKFQTLFKSIETKAENLTKATYFLNMLIETLNARKDTEHETRLVQLSINEGNLLPGLKETIEHVETIHKTWSFLIDITTSFEDIGSQLWKNVSPEQTQSQVQALIRKLNDIPEVSKQLPFWKQIVRRYESVAGLFRFVKQLSSPIVKKRHWMDLSKELDNNTLQNFFENTLKLKDVWDSLQSNSSDNAKKCKIILAKAQGEAALEKFVIGVEHYWSHKQLTLINATAVRHICKLLTGWDELMAKLEEDISTLNSMHNSPYFQQFADKITKWEERLNNSSNLFTVWADVQQRWLHLQTVFSVSSENQELGRQLAAEMKQMKYVQEEFVKVMWEVQETPAFMNIVQTLNNPPALPLQKKMEVLSSNLQQIQKSLGDFLESQRQRFPRLYFVGDEDLLEIISAGTDVMRLQRHWRKMFAGIADVVFEFKESDGENDTLPEPKSIIGMRSAEGEETFFKKGVHLDSLKAKNSKTSTINIHELFQVIESLAWETVRSNTLQFLISIKKIIHGEALVGAINCFKDSDLQEDRDAYISLRHELVQWMKHPPIQCILLSFQILWTSLIEEEITEQRLPTHALDVVVLVLDILSTMDTTALEGDAFLFERARSLLVSELIHLREATRKLIDEGINTQYGFNMSATLRFYWRDEIVPRFVGSLPSTEHFKDIPRQGDVEVCMSEATMSYGWEYQGAGSRIVQTPLTDNCYLTLTQALHYRLGGSPFGPAGTGKTESVKALGTQLGRFVLVFNCDENFDDSAMGRIFVGLCECGCFGCMDEFNRLDEASLSAVSQQILAIQTSLKEGCGKTELLGRDVSLNPNVGIFITMNPGYAGRQELPDNLKGLFRSVAMIEPDRPLIAQVMLFSQGFKNAEKLSRQIVPLFRLCFEQLSPQPHYDWGLRAMKAVLLASGRTKRRLLAAQANAEEASDEKSVDYMSLREEQKIIVQALLTSVLPKLVSSDVPLFESLLEDIFPSISVALKGTEELMKIAEAVCLENGLILHKAWLDKITQVFLTTEAHQGTMLVGPSGAGKTACLQVLLKALEAHTGNVIKSFVISPKALSKDELYGTLDPMTREWEDGVFTAILRDILASNGTHQERLLQLRSTGGNEAQAPKETTYYVIFDGSVDPVWVENLNSVLDDNRTLTLPSGERLPLPENVRLIFEVLDLKHATLATVSRCGMVWFSHDTLPTDISLRGVMEKLKVIPVSDKDKWNSLIEKPWAKFGKGVLQGMEFDQVSLKEPLMKLQQLASDVWNILFCARGNLPTSYCEMLSTILESICNKYDVMEFTFARVATTIRTLLFDAIMEFLAYCSNNISTESSHLTYNNILGTLDEERIASFFKKRMILALAWGFGASLSHEGRLEVCEVITDQLKQCPEYVSSLPSDEHTLLDVSAPCDSPDWVPWIETVESMTLSEEEVGFRVVPTVDTARHSFLIGAWLRQHVPLVLCGPAGSGKSMSLDAALSSMHDYQHVGLNFSSCTSPDIIRQYLSRYCTRKNKQNYSTMELTSKNVHNLVLMCDEINLPEEDEYGTQRVIAFIRSLVEHQGFWDPTDNTWVHLRDVYFAGACNPPTDPGRHPMTSRFLRHSPVLLVDFPTVESLHMIYNCFNSAVLQRFSSASQLASSVSNSMIQVYSETRKRLTPDLQPHYIYSPRELTRWTRAIKTNLSTFEDVLPEDLVCLVYHEGLRLFQDRIVDEDDKAWTRDLVHSAVSNSFVQCDVEDAIGDRLSPVLFSQWLSKREYEQTSMDELRVFVQRYLQSFQNEVINVDVVLFDEVIEHMLRIDRVLRQPVGHLLLAGASGSGKTLLAKFVAHINEYEVREVNTYRGYTLEVFEDELRACMKSAGVAGNNVVFIFDESNALDTSFTEHMNALLAAGDVVGLFEGDERKKLFGEIREKVKHYSLSSDDLLLQTGSFKEPAVDASSSDDELYDWFRTRVRNKLHVVFTMNPPKKIKGLASASLEGANSNGGESMQDKAATSPALFNRCVVDWIGDWGLSQVFQIAVHHCSRLNISEAADTPDSQMGQEEAKQLNQETFSLLSDPSKELEEQVSQLAKNCSSLPLPHRVARAVARCHLVAQREADNVKKFYTGKPGAGLLAGGSQQHATPRHFMRFLNAMLDLWKSKEANREQLSKHTRDGLHALEATQKQVNGLKEELSEKSRSLEQASTEADQKLQEMLEEKAKAESRKKISEQLSVDIAMKQKEIDERKEGALKELAEVEPLIQKALASVKSIKKSDFDELRALARPPEGVRLAMEAVCLTLGKIKRATEWNDIRKIIRQDTFLGSVLSYNTDKQLTSSVSKRVSNYISNPAFSEEAVFRASKAAGPMVLWVKSQMMYATISAKVEPLRKEVATLESDAAEMTEKARAVKDEISELEERIERFKVDYKNLIRFAEKLKVEMKTVKKKVDRAIALMDSLSGERQRWQAQNEEWKQSARTFAGDMILSSAFAAYSGSFPQDIRLSLVSSWKAILVDSGIDVNEDLIIHEFLSFANDRDNWLSNGLPNDDISIANAAVMLQARDSTNAKESDLVLRCATPLFVDPSGQATQWLKHQFGDKLKLTSFLSPTFVRSLEQAVRFGMMLLVEDAEHFDPIVNPLLEIKALRSELIGSIVRLGTKEIDFSSSFSMIFVTRNSAATFPPAFCSRCTVLNFTVTQSSLRSQCLNYILQYECPEVGTERQRLLQEEREYIVRLRELETQLLEILSTSQGTILDNEDVAATLERVKQEATEVEAKQTEAIEVREKLDEASVRYVFFSNACAALFFTIRELSSVHFSLYFTLAFFQRILESVMEDMAYKPKATHQKSRNRKSKAKNDLDDGPTRVRMERVVKELVKRLFRFVGTAMPTSLRLPFALALANTIYKAAESSEEVEDRETPLEARLMTQATSLGIGGSEFKAKSASISPEQAKLIGLLASHIPEAEPLIEELSASDRLGAAFRKPDAFVRELNEFWESCGNAPPLAALFTFAVARAAFPAYVEVSANSFVKRRFGGAFASEPENVELGHVEEQFGAQWPILVLSSGGYDATDKIVQLARVRRVKLANLPVGAKNSTAQRIRAQMTQGMSAGSWILISNLHLAGASFTTDVLMAARESLALAAQKRGRRKDFRVFLTSALQPNLPSALFQETVRVVEEPSPGLSMQVQRSLALLDSVETSARPAERARVHFLVALLHGILTQRTRYLPIGWLKDHEISSADFLAAVRVADSWIDARAGESAHLTCEHIPWEAIRGILKASCYGGKIHAPSDKRILSSLVDRILSAAAFEDGFQPIAVGPDEQALAVPAGTELAALRAWVAGLDPVEPPAWIGLPRAAKDLLMQQEGREFTATLAQICAEAESIEAEEAENVGLEELVPMAERWPELLAAVGAIPALELNAKDPVVRCVARESLGLQALGEVVRKDSALLALVCAGEAARTNRINAVLDGLSSGSVPRPWLDDAPYSVPPALHADSFVVDLCARLKHVQALAGELSSGGSLAGAAVWLGGFSQPRAFLTALRQLTARETKQPLEDFKLRVDLAGRAPAGPHVRVTGARINGARWSREAGVLVPSDAAAQPLAEFALFWETAAPPPRDIPLPVFVDERRAETVFEAAAPAADGVDPSFWFLRGAALTLWGAV
eukprot:gnl/Chilomastix_cuspidata/1746.p1 GENE.gnl/Chilomastix_cuspidata/1746~~gnl/Chilomastix_cuspidata/1746.p1  ORF type:complete len:4985 (-),score=1600.97 gnl/Chilomastix_cuspidata/1746:1376-14452(-)